VLTYKVEGNIPRGDLYPWRFLEVTADANTNLSF
jgi:hypothetical protein